MARFTAGLGGGSKSKRSKKEKPPKYSTGRSSRFTVIIILALILRLAQFVMGIVVIGMYGIDLNKANKEHKYSDSKWVYAVTIGTLSSLTALIYILLLIFTSFPGGRFIPTIVLSAWDLVLVILWAAVLGIFGTMYFHENAEMDVGVKRMKAAAWIDLVNFLLWLISVFWAAVEIFRLKAGGGGSGGAVGSYAGRGEMSYQ